MFFDPNEVFKYNFLMNFVVSERGSGKTFSTLLNLVKQFDETGEQIVYVRRTDAELELATPTLLTQLQSEGYFSEDVFMIKNGVMFKNTAMIGRCVAINTAYKLKSVSFPKVKTIIFDEFISENGRYLKNEPEKLLSLIETIGRMRDIRIIMLGNQNTKYNPYYIYFGIKPAGKNLTRFRDRSILIYEFSSNEYREKKKETKFGKLISGTRYGEFMLNNEAIDDDYSFIDTMKGCKKNPVANIILERQNIVVYDCIGDEAFVLFFIIKPAIEGIRTINFDEMLVENATIESLRSHPISRRISMNIKRGTVRFNDMPAKLLVENFIF